jgi:hypothetical protein
MEETDWQLVKKWFPVELREPASCRQGREGHWYLRWGRDLLMVIAGTDKWYLYDCTGPVYEASNNTSVEQVLLKLLPAVARLRPCGEE